MIKNLLSSIRKDLHHHVKSFVFSALVVLGITVMSGNVPGSVFVTVILGITALFALHDLSKAMVRPSAILYTVALGGLAAWLPFHQITAISYYVIVLSGVALLNHFRRVPTAATFGELREDLHHTIHIVLLEILVAVGVLVMHPYGVPAWVFIATILGGTAVVIGHGLRKNVEKSSLVYTAAYGGLLAGLPFVFGGPLPLLFVTTLFGALLVHHRLVIAAHHRRLATGPIGARGSALS